VLGAQRAIEEGDLNTARERLENHLPRLGVEDRRSFEWYYLWQSLKGEELASWRVEGGEPRWITVSGDGRWVAAAGTIFDIRQGEVIRRLPKRRSALVFEPQGPHLMVKASNGVYRVNVQTGDEQFLATGGETWAAAFSSTGRWFAVGGDAGLTLWDAHRWERVAARPDLTFSFFTARGIAFAPDETRVLVNTGNPLREIGELQELALPSLGDLGPAWSDSRNIAGMEYSRDGTELLTGGWDGRVLLRNLQEPNRPVREITHLLSWIADVRYDPGSSRIIVAGADRLLRFLEREERAKGRSLRGHTGEIWGMVPSPDGSNVFTLGADRTVRRWSAHLPSSPLFLQPNPDPIHPVGVSRDGWRLATRSAERLSLWRVEGRELREDMARRIEMPELRSVPADPLRGQGMVAAAPDLETFVLALPGRPVEVRSWKDGSIQRLAGTVALEPLVGYSPNGRILVIALDERHLSFWHTGALRPMGNVEIGQPNDGRWPWAFAAKTNVVAVGSKNEVVLWRTDSIRKLRTIPTGPFRAMALSPDASLLVVGGSDGAIRTFDVESGRALGPAVQGHLSSVDALAFSGDGRFLATGGDQRIKFREVAGFRELFVGRHSGPVIFAMFSANDELLVTADAGLSVRIWPAPRADELDERTRSQTRRGRIMVESE
jgi:WD40 repeat protein